MSRRAHLFLVMLLAVSCGDEPPAWQVAGRRDLLLDGERVELVAGFEGVSAVRILGDVPRVNRDRDEVIVPMPRNGRLRWHLDARRGRFVSAVTRLRAGPEEDATSARLILTAHRGEQTVARVEVAVPAVAIDAQAPGSALREGPSAPVVLALPDGADMLDFEFVADDGQALGYLALLSPRVEQEPRRVAPAAHPLRFEREQRLAASLVEGEPRPLLFATASNDLVTDEPVTVDAVEFLGAFEGRIGRRALVLTGDTRVELDVDIAPGAVLRGDLGLDDRLPHDTVARLVVSVDGEVAASSAVPFGDWLPLAVPLERWAGTRRRLAFELSADHFEPAPVSKRVRDYARGAEVPTLFLAGQVRLGIADPRIATPARVARRVASSGHPSVLLLHVETLRADLLPGFGGQLDDLAPNLARLVACSTVYETAIAPSSWTLPSTATLLTGLPPSAHGVVHEDRSVLPDEVPTLAERARDAGVPAAAVVTNTLLRPDAGFARGFDPYVQLPHRNARQVNDVVRTLLSDGAGQQQLLFVHYYDPHHPYDAPDGWRDRYLTAELVDNSDRRSWDRVMQRLGAGQQVAADDPDVRFLRERYLGEIAWFDEQLGELLAFLDSTGLAQTTCVVLTADHGEEFLEHDLLGHGSQLFDETLRVPLIVAEPGALVGWAAGAEAGSGRRVSHVVGTGGLFAEVLGRLDVPFDADAVLPSVDAPPSARPVAVAETRKGLALFEPGRTGDPLRRTLRAVRSDDHLLVWYLPVAEEQGDGTMCFYDLAADPRALHPADAVGPEAAWHRRALEQALEWSEQRRATVPAAGFDAAMHANLQALGYLQAPGGVERVPCDG